MGAPAAEATRASLDPKLPAAATVAPLGANSSSARPQPARAGSRPSNPPRASPVLPSHSVTVVLAIRRREPSGLKAPVVDPSIGNLRTVRPVVVSQRRTDRWKNPPV